MTTVSRAADLPQTDAHFAAEVARTQGLLPIPVGGLPRHGNVGYSVDVILARDTWLHRHDIATHSMTTSDPTSAEVVAQVVRDLALAWHDPGIVLTLTGAEGGTWLIGTDRNAPTASVPAVEFLRHLSGRQVRQEMWAAVPEAVRPSLASARVKF